MQGWTDNIEQLTKENLTFRTVLYTGKHSQLTVMNVQPGEEIGNEVHPGSDQFIRLEQGIAKLTLGPDENTVEQEYELKAGWAGFIPAGTWHNVINIGATELKLYSVYSPAEHPEGTVHQTKAEADAAED